MEDRTFTLLEKMYSEFINFKEETSKRFDRVDGKFERIDERFEKMDERFEKIDERFEKMDLRLGGLEDKFDGMNTRLQRIEAKIDGEITPKITALFDGYKANSEKLEEVSDKIDSLQVDVNNLSIKVASNDNKIIEMKRTLRSV